MTPEGIDRDVRRIRSRREAEHAAAGVVLAEDAAEARRAAVHVDIDRDRFREAVAETHRRANAQWPRRRDALGMLIAHPALMGITWTAVIMFVVSEAATVDGLALALAAIIIGPPAYAAARHRRRAAREAADRASARTQIAAARRFAAREKMWWPEPDGSISIGGKRITVDVPGGES